MSPQWDPHSSHQFEFQHWNDVQRNSRSLACADRWTRPSCLGLSTKCSFTHNFVSSLLWRCHCFCYCKVAWCSDNLLFTHVYFNTAVFRLMKLSQFKIEVECFSAPATEQSFGHVMPITWYANFMHDCNPGTGQCSLAWVFRGKLVCSRYVTN
jgi:hypothetical protein